jgi:hypothetical protein
MSGGSRGGGWSNGGGWSHGGGSWGHGGCCGHGFHNTVFIGVPFFTGFGLGFGWGWSAFNPWFWGGPYYGWGGPWGWGPSTVYYDSAAPPGTQAVPPPGAEESQAPAACGSWVWDTAKQAYHWVPC